MPEQNVDNIAFLREAGEALAELKEAQEAAKEQDLQTKRLEKSLASEKKAVADSIEMTIRKRKAEITDSYDSQIEQTQVIFAVIFFAAHACGQAALLQIVDQLGQLLLGDIQLAGQVSQSQHTLIGLV